jgi:multiple sugar transport system permease protein
VKGAGSRDSVSVAYGALWISPWAIGFLVFMLAPALMSLYYSFTDYSLLETPVWVGWANFRELLGDTMFRTAVGNTLYFAFVSVVLGAMVSVGVAAMLEQRVRGASLVRAVVFLPTLVPVISACVCWGWLFNSELGLFNAVLRPLGPMLTRLGVESWPPNWLGSPRLAMPSFIFMSLWTIGSAAVIYSAALKGVPRSLYEAADLDGATGLRRFASVTLPMISPAVLFNSVVSLIWSLQIFAPPQVITRGGPENSTLVYQMYVYSNAFVYGRMGYACALAWIQLLVTLGLTLVVLGLSKRFVYYRTA